MSLGQRFVSAVAGASAKDWFQYGGRALVLVDDDPAATKAVQFIDKFSKDHGKVPSLSTLREATGLPLPDETTDAEFLFEQLGDRRIKRVLALAGTDAQKMLANDPRKAMQHLHGSLVQLVSETAVLKVYDFKEAVHTLWPWITSKWAGEARSVPLPWPTLAKMAGGIYGGELVSTVARTGAGKTWLQLDLALHIWRTTKYPIVFVSLEMMARKIMERLAALYTHTPMDLFKDPIAANWFVEDPKLKLYKDLVALEASDLPPFIVVDGQMAADVDDVVGITRRYDPAACVIDGAYMLKHPDPRKAKHERITENIEAIKRDIATAQDMAVFCSWQFNRDALKVKKDEMPGPEHVGGGDGIGNTSSILLGLFQGDEPEKGNVSQVNKRKVHILKGRDGERGSFEIGWDFTKMDFAEWDPNAVVVYD